MGKIELFNYQGKKTLSMSPLQVLTKINEDEKLSKKKIMKKKKCNNER